ncbi:MAG TPA: 2-succinyl-5-enolpyruvyl-6-hydroxy-3-cyclohexene-1-carboxylic-acid synthase [Acidimicrobiales bacterium]|nr:2-succinyl-5-enolpyruvyl-6-hydroxy-3-cyclohexene-1-carboxylic-acid synthase [Acidimicrobiales bacterium]
MTSSPLDNDTQAAFAAVLVDEWARAGVTDAVVAPGSRSTPMLVALAERAEEGALRLHVVLDERSAGFIALGLGRAAGRPAVVLTTSGTAAVELHPAVVEADQSGTPLLVVTADRPPELHGCGAPQTVPQTGIFGSATRWEASPGVAEMAASGSWRSLASRAFAEALGGARGPGPVHLNLAFREPLVGPAGAGAAFAGRPGGSPWHSVAPPGPQPASEEVVAMLARAGTHALVIAGPGTDAPSEVFELSQAAGWPVLADPLSGCRWPGAIASADALLRVPSVRAWEPAMVLRLGAPWLSRVVNGWLAELPCPQVLVDRWGSWAAPDRRPELIVPASPGTVCRQVAAAVRGPSDRGWAEQWAFAERLAQEAIGQVLGQVATVSEPALARELVAWLPEGSVLMVSASMPVRDLEWWSKPRKGVRFLANRGANGIDGVLSTAIGVALGNDMPTWDGPAHRASSGARAVALVGDLAFIYDSGSLAFASRLGARLDVVVVDNNGGGIFNFLPQAHAQPAERFERLWGTPHGLDLCEVAESFGASSQRVHDVRGLLEALSIPTPGGVRVIVVPVERGGNVAVHKQLHEAVVAAVGSVAPGPLTPPLA